MCLDLEYHNDCGIFNIIALTSHERKVFYRLLEKDIMSS